MFRRRSAPHGNSALARKLQMPGAVWEAEDDAVEAGVVFEGREDLEVEVCGVEGCQCGDVVGWACDAEAAR